MIVRSSSSSTVPTYTNSTPKYTPQVDGFWTGDAAVQVAAPLKSLVSSTAYTTPLLHVCAPTLALPPSQIHTTNITVDYHADTAPALTCTPGCTGRTILGLRPSHQGRPAATCSYVLLQAAACCATCQAVVAGLQRHLLILNWCKDVDLSRYGLPAAKDSIASCWSWGPSQNQYVLFERAPKRQISQKNISCCARALHCASRPAE